MTAQAGATQESGSASRDDLRAMYRRMYLIRRFETRTGVLYRDGEIPGFVHLAVGQEAAAVGACSALGDGDVITSTHRGHAHALARGLTPHEMFAELMGRETGVCHGRGGSMHIADPARGIFGANGIVGAGIPIAAGAAFAARYTGTNNVALAFLGDGAIATGAFHEAANLASLWKLPLILFCENNRFSEFSRFEDQHPVDVAQRAGGYGLDYHQVDGNDVDAVHALMSWIVPHLRDGGGPCLIEALTLRHHGHYEGDPQLYRSDEDYLDVADPLARSRSLLAGLGVSEQEFDALHADVNTEIEQAIDQARQEPWPVPGELDRDMIVVREPSPPPILEELSSPDPGGASWKLFQAVGAALEAELNEDPSVFIAGIDVGAGGNIFGITRGLCERFPGRLWDTPISETAIMGLGTGAAMAGLKPVVELMYFDFLGVCLDQLMNQAAKLRYMTGGRAQMALTVRTQFGAGRSSGAQHSQSLEALLAHIPGLTVVMPSTPSDAYGLLRSAIQDPNPVVFIENRLQYGLSGPRCDPGHRIPIGQAAKRRQGTDLTIVSYSRMVHDAVEAADQLATEGISCDVIDLRTIAPLDVSSVLDSVAKTNRLLIVQEACRDFGVGAEIAARIADEGVWHLDAPIVRVGAMATPAPYSPALERAWLPDVERIVSSAKRVIES